ncbi:tripartite tricarboxylate transporter substrate binding protein [Neoroseomonas oryzicola]|uniref:Tripartite tricarboxylate transporter substrate binding protein n=1 Tax=Neoroseomonas oryzicola TaxID=535904 RepID=A0A9X9WBH8_9PROT|nr:tripartite tricarboxylate transporter substrate binding protein [Neoroseomonas oryzicola]MBR0657688.1 tripartite tricarboxylate transporter substrate binding protein [Neoroseomonas oryzicola]NKE18944.1 tripartite tricarboxylate transporter substrate binding protein [Neoroseomonas oryzicola]
MSITLRRRHLPALAAGMAVAGAGAARADWPEREIQLVVNYGAGGNTDVSARAFSRGLERQLGKPVVVVNRPGAEGTIGPAFVATQRPDGYTIGVVTYSTVAIQPHVRDVPYTIGSFDFVAGYGRFRYGVTVRADSPHRTLDDLVRAAKQGNGLFVGAPSAPNNLAMFELGRLTGGKFEQVQYRSGAETVTALLGGQVDVIVQNPSDVVAQIRAGQLRLLASASPMRWQEFPDVPTMREAGYEVEIDSWLGIAVPRGTPRPVLERLEAASLAALRDPAVAEQIGATGVDPQALPGKEYEALLARGAEQMGPILRRAGMAKP